MGKSLFNQFVLAVGLGLALVVLVSIAQKDRYTPTTLAATAADTPLPTVVGDASNTGITMTLDPLLSWQSTPENSMETRVSVSVAVYVGQTSDVTNTQYYSVSLYYGDGKNGGFANHQSRTTDETGKIIVPSKTAVYTMSFSVPLTHTGNHTLRTTLHRVFTQTNSVDSNTVGVSVSFVLSDTKQTLIAPAIGLQVVPLSNSDGRIYPGQDVRFTAFVTPAIRSDDGRDRFWVADSAKANTILFRADRNDSIMGLSEQMISGTNQIIWTHRYTRTGSFLASADFKSGVNHIYGNAQSLVMATQQMNIVTPTITLSINPTTTSYVQSTGDIVASASIPDNAAIGYTSTVIFNFGDGANDTQSRQLLPGATVVTATKKYINTSTASKVYNLQATLSLGGSPAFVVVPSNQITLTVDSVKAYHVVVKPTATEVLLPAQGSGSVSVTTYLADSNGKQWIPTERGQLNLKTSFGALNQINIDENFSSSAFLLSSDIAGTSQLVASFGTTSEPDSISGGATVSFVRSSNTSTQTLEVALDPTKSGTTSGSLDGMTFVFPNSLYTIPVIVKITAVTPTNPPSGALVLGGFLVEVFDAEKGYILPALDFRDGATISLTYLAKSNATTPSVIVSTVYTSRFRDGVWTVVKTLVTPQTALGLTADAAQVVSQLPSPGTYGKFGSSNVLLYLPFVQR
jgi:hypothetical protein